MYMHGGNIYKASQTYGIKIEDILDYSANINPLGLPEGLRELLASAFDSLVNYPEPEYLELRTEISKYLNLAIERIIPGNGASEVIYLLMDVLRLKRILIPAPSFNEYKQAAILTGAEVEYFELKEDNSFKVPVNELADKLGNGYDALLLCNPNNPTSRLISKTELYEILRFTSSRGIYVIIDEAFIELTEGGNNNSMVEALESYDNLFIIRAFTKIFAIPGLRLGYGIGNSRLIEAMWKRKTPWSINSLAACTGKLLNCSGDYMQRTAEWLALEKMYLYKELRKIKGLKVFEPQSNFILIKILINEISGGQLKDIMAQKGILIRDASNFTFLDNKYFRIAIKDRESNTKLLALLNEVIKNNTF